MTERAPRQLQEYVNERPEFLPLLLLLCDECSVEHGSTSLFEIMATGNFTAVEALTMWGLLTTQPHPRVESGRGAEMAQEDHRISQGHCDRRRSQSAENCAAESLDEHFERLGMWPLWPSQ
jgi:hypothetical protein